MVTAPVMTTASYRHIPAGCACDWDYAGDPRRWVLDGVNPCCWPHGNAPVCLECSGCGHTWYGNVRRKCTGCAGNGRTTRPQGDVAAEAAVTEPAKGTAA